MADKPIGTIFVELDLDPSRYTKGQQKLLKDAQTTTLNIEQNFKNLGIKSSAEMDLMRAKIKNSFDAIANSHKSTANDIVRAEQAKNQQLAALNAKQFGDQTSLIDSIKSKWLAVAVTIYGTYKAIGQAIDQAQIGSKLQKQEVAFGNLATAAGTSKDKILASLRAVSKAMVAESDLIQASGKALLMGLPAADITKYMEIAAATSRQTGQTVTEAFADITMGVARQSRMILDNLGIIVDAEQAYQDYAKALGKSADALTDAEKRQAFANATMKAGEDMIKRLGDSQVTLDGANKLIAAQKNLWDEVGKSVAQMLDKELSSYAKMINWIDEKLKKMRQGASDSLADLLKEIEMLRSLESKGMAQPGTTSAKMAEYNRRSGGRSEAEAADIAALEAWRKTDRLAAWREREGQWVDFTADELKAMKDERGKYLDEGAAQTKKAESVLNKFHEEYLRATTDQYEFERAQIEEQFRVYQQYIKDKGALNRWYAGEMDKINKKESDWIEKSSEKAAYYASGRSYSNVEHGWHEALLEEIRLTDELTEKEADLQAYYERVKGSIEDVTRSQEIFNDTMNIMSQTAADAFASFVTGTASAKDAFTSMAQSMISAMTRMATQKMFEQIFGMIASGIGSYFVGGTPAGWASPWEHAQGGVFGSEGRIAFARGGVVNRPATFPFANGIGLMGEAGPEAILPLTRLPGGKLGVEASIKGGVSTTTEKINLIVHNYSNEKVKQKSNTKIGNERTIEVMFGSKVYAGGPFSKSMENVYGLRRQGNLV